MFCDLDGLRRVSEVTVEDDYCLFANEAAVELLPGSAAIVPKAHRPTVFDLTDAEVAATFQLLREAQPLLDRRYRPDGYTIGWNCHAASGQSIPHAHLHVLLRYADEPKAGHGLRWWLKQPDNRRPDPRAPGSGDRSYG
ncbi:MAG TPA: HIT domain-containing protein [Gaiellales bacterium]|jgi:diadenosine tetraphosphate (Ap4A) HIT family hydrolase|nr:HIT domain-containing protein [Gaiellales bacterium]